MTTPNFPISRSLRMATVYAGLFLTLMPQFSRPLEAVELSLSRHRCFLSRFDTQPLQRYAPSDQLVEHRVQVLLS
jgi:hypothetical protein